MASQMAKRSGHESFRYSTSPLLSSSGPLSGTASPPPPSSSHSAATAPTSGPSVLHRPRPKQPGNTIDLASPSRSSPSSFFGLVDDRSSSRPSVESDRYRDREPSSSSSSSFRPNDVEGALSSPARHSALRRPTSASSSESEEDDDDANVTQRGGRRNSFFGVAANQDDDGEGESEGVSSGAGTGASAQRSDQHPRGNNDDEGGASAGRPSMSSSITTDPSSHRDERRSSFYGLDAHMPSSSNALAPSHHHTVAAAAAGGSSHEPSLTANSSSSNAHSLHHYAQRHPHQQHHYAGGASGGDSGSGSYSSHELRTSSGAATTSSSGAATSGQTHLGAAGQGAARYYSAPYAASRSASLYNQPGANGTGGGPIDHSPSSMRLLSDQSHLQPGSLASLLSHEKTLDLYRANAKKTDDPDIQFELCTFTMELVAEMEAAAGAERGTTVESGVMDSTGAVTTGLTASASHVLTKENKENGAPSDLTSRHKQQELVAESVALLNKLATRGHVKSQYFLADCYTQGVGTAKGKRDYDKAFPLFMLAGKHGHSDACFRAAQCCENAWGTKKDYSKAVTLLRRSAVLNHPGAMHRLGIAELNGEIGLAKRPREGVKWLKRAAELADQVDPPQPQSLHELAVLHETGIDNVVFKDEEYAAELLARAAELHFAPSAYKLGECYEYGRMGCPQDSALSIHYYNIAAQQGHREACFALTAWYLVGSPGVLPQSDTEAYLWARKAAALELAKAEYAVGYFTEMGIGTHKDAREAIDWFRKAASHGDKRAIDRLRMAGASVETLYGRPAPQARQLQPPPPPSSAYKPPPQTRSAKSPRGGQAFGLGSQSGQRGKSIDTTMRSASAGNPISPNDDRGRPYDHDLDAALRAMNNAGRPALPRQRSASQPSFSTEQYQRPPPSPKHQMAYTRAGGPPTPPKLPASQSSWVRSNSPAGRGSPSRGPGTGGSAGRPPYPPLQIGEVPHANSRMLPPGAGRPQQFHQGGGPNSAPAVSPVGRELFDRALPRPPFHAQAQPPPQRGESNVLSKRAPLPPPPQNAGPLSAQASGGKSFWRRK